jgi:Cu-Zn family superoxide dismutase
MRQPLAGAALAAFLIAAPALADEMSSDVVNNQGNKIGTIKVQDGPHGIVVNVALDKGALPAGAHGIHVHEHGDCSDTAKFEKSKGHVNPDKTEHGFLNPKGPHPSDMPNLYAHSDGSALAEIFVPAMTISESAVSLAEDGSAIVIHANPDDHLSQPIGGAGARLACAAFKK